MKLMLPFGVMGLVAMGNPAVAATDQVRPADPQNTQLNVPAANQLVVPGSSKNPFARVFRAPNLAEQERLRARLAAELLLRAITPETEVICGLTVRHVDERQDPRIIVPLRDPRVDAKIKRITPVVCLSTAAPSR